MAPFATLDEALNAVPKIIQSKSNPIAIEFFERVTVLFAEEYLGKKFPDTKSNYYLLLTFDGMTKEIVTQAYKEAADLLLDELGALDVFIVDTDERKDPFGKPGVLSWKQSKVRPPKWTNATWWFKKRDCEIPEVHIYPSGKAWSSNC